MSISTTGRSSLLFSFLSLLFFFLSFLLLYIFLIWYTIPNPWLELLIHILLISPQDSFGLSCFLEDYHSKAFAFMWKCSSPTGLSYLKCILLPSKYSHLDHPPITLLIKFWSCRTTPCSWPFPCFHYDR